MAGISLLYGLGTKTVPPDKGGVMTQEWTRILKIAALAGVIGVSCMQGAVQATFHLPVETHWGKDVLAPGDYRILVPDMLSGPHRVSIQGNGQTIYETVQAIDVDPQVSNPALKLIEHDGAYFVKEYRSGVAGATYSFGIPKTHGAVNGKLIESTK